MKKISVSAPGKLMLLGEHAVVYGKPCIVTAVNQRVRVKVEKKRGGSIFINAPDVNVAGYVQKIGNLDINNSPKGAKFIIAAVHNFFSEYGVKSGLRIETRSDFSSEFGFGSSSAVTVAVIKALSEIFNLKITRHQLFDLSYKTILDVQGVGSGFDLAATIWGGTIYFVKGGKRINPIKTKELPIIVGYTGIKADTPTIVKRVAVIYKRNKVQVEKIFDTIGALVESAGGHISTGNYIKLGKLMNQNEDLLVKLGVETPELKKLILAARGAGAYGAKLSGAGGGDCMIALVNKDTRLKVDSAIKEARGKVLRVKTGDSGVKVEK